MEMPPPHRNNRVVALERQWQAARADGLQLTAVVSLEDFPLVAQKGPEGCPAAYWGFSHGINATFQYPIQDERAPNVLIDTPMEKELDSDNGEGIDAFTADGTKKQQLLLSVYFSEKAAPYWMRSASRATSKRGLFACMTARIPAPWTDDPVTIMQWHFHQINNVSLTGDPNILTHSSGARITLSLESEEAAD